MKYFVFDHQRNGSCYYEFYKGKWDGKTFWNPDSISIHDDYFFDGFADAIIEIVPYYVSKVQYLKCNFFAFCT